MTTSTLRSRSATGTTRSDPSTSHRVSQRTPLVFISPFFILYGLFMVVPILVGLYLSLTEWAGLGAPVFVGLRNYVNLMQDGSFWGSALNTGIYTAFVLVVVIPASLLIAVALNTKGLKLRDFFRTLYFVPVILSPIIIALVFGLIFDGQSGLLNAVTNALFGAPPIGFLTDPVWAKVVVVVLVLWRWTGYLTIFFMAGLQAISADQYEAAELDGAGAVQRFFAVTLPNLRPVTAFVVVTMLVATAQIFEEPFLLTQGGPGEATLSIGMFIYRAAFQLQHVGYASAAGVIMFILVFGLGRIANRVLRVGKDI